MNADFKPERAPIVGVLSIVPDAASHRLGSVEGIIVVLCRLDLTKTSIVLHARAEQSPNTDDRLASYRREWSEFEQRFAQLGAARAGKPPTQPGDILNQIRITVTDEKRTDFGSAVIRTAGTGTEWDASWEWDRPPRAGQELEFHCESPTDEALQFTLMVPEVPMR